MDHSQKFSVIMTAYNAEETIGRALENAMNLAGSPAQIIVVDDNSSDKTSEILIEYRKRDPRIFVVKNSNNLGQSKSRNIAVDKSQSEYLIFMDDDDVSLKNRAMLHLEMLESGADLSYVSTSKIYPSGYVVQNINTSFGDSQGIPTEILRYLIIGERSTKFENLYSPSCALGVRRTSFIKLGGFREDMRRLEDIDFTCRALESNLKISWSSDVAVIRFDTPGNDKSSEANAKGELLLVDSFTRYFTRRELVSYRIMVDFRKKYFSGQRKTLLLSAHKVLLLLAIDPRRMLSMCRRLIHDYHRRKS